MSKNTKKKVDNVIKPRTTTSRIGKKKAKKIDLAASAELFKHEFSIYCIDPSMDILDYMDEHGNVDIESLPEDYLLEFVCKYLDPGTFLNVVDTPFAVDIPDDEGLTEEEKEKKLEEIYKKRMESRRNDVEVQSYVIHACCIDPKFESPEHVQAVLPISLIIDLGAELTRGSTGKNLVSRF